MFCEVTKIIHSFVLPKVSSKVLIHLFFHCIFTIYLILFYVNDSIVNEMLFLHGFYIMRPLIRLSTALHKKANKELQKWRVLAFCRIAPKIRFLKILYYAHFLIRQIRYPVKHQNN